MMHPFDVLGHPVRRRILEILGDSEQSSGEIVSAIHREFGITQSAVSQHLKVLRDNGFATSTVDGARRLYAIEVTPIEQVDAWLSQFRGFWERRLDALATEVAQGKAGRDDPANGE